MRSRIMPLTVSALHQQAEQFTVEFAGETLTGTYRAHAFTPELEDLISGADETKTRSRTFTEAMARLVAGWDLLDKPGGKPWPITPEKLAQLPSALLLAVMTAIAEKNRPNPTTSDS